MRPGPTDCWCGEDHVYEPSNPTEAVRNLWHLIIAELKIPQLMKWFARRIW